MRTQRIVALAFIGLLMAVSFSNAQPRWQWVHTAVGPAFDEGWSLAMGPDGDLHFAGTYYDSIDFEGTVMPAIGNYDVYSARYSKTGALRDWDAFGGLYNDDGHSIVVDKNGNIYIGGYFNEAAQIGGEIVDGLGDATSDDIFITKFDKFGVPQWTKVFGSPESDDDIPYIAVDSLGNVYLTGGFAGRAEFDSKTVTSAGKQDIYVAKLTSAGMTTWVHSYGSIENDLGLTINVTPNGDRIYVGGTFIGPVYFGTKEITSFDGRADVFVQCFSSNGSVLWADRIGSTNVDRDIASCVDKDGKLVLTGTIWKQTTFFNKQVSANGEFFSDMYVARITKDGSVELLKNYGGPYDDGGLAITTDARGSFYVAGYFDSTSTFGGTVVHSAGDRDAFASRIFPNGDFEWIRTAGGTHDDMARGIAVDKDGIPYVMGVFDTEAAFGDVVVKGVLTDIFLAALECGPDTHLNPSTSPITICEAQDTSLTTRGGYPAYQWFVNGSADLAGTSNRYKLDKLPVGTHTVYVHVTDFYSCALNSDTITVNVIEGLPLPTITRLGQDLSTDVTGVMYQWYLEGQPIAGATSSFITISGEGYYRVLIYDERGCSRWSDNFLVGTTGVSGDDVAQGVFPNPFSESFTIIGWEGATVDVFDLLGNMVAHNSDITAAQGVRIDGVAGTYVLRITTAREQRSVIVTKH